MLSYYLGRSERPISPDSASMMTCMMSVYNPRWGTPFGTPTVSYPQRPLLQVTNSMGLPVRALVSC